MKYIDSEKLVAKIQPYYENAKCKARYAGETGTSSDCIKWDKAKEIYEHVLRIISSLQQEQPEVDLNFQVFAKEMDAVFNLPKEVTENTEENPLNWEYAIASHFYELGLNARKEE